MEDIKFVKILLYIICGLVSIVLVLGYFAFKKDNSAELKALHEQNVRITKQLDSLSITMASKLDSIKVIEKKTTNTKTIYQRDIFHVWDVSDKDSLAEIIRAQMNSLKNPKID